MKHIRTLAFPLCLVLAACLSFAAERPAPAVPDYSQGERAAVPEAFRWRLEDVYPTPAAWQADLDEAGRGLEKLSSLLQAPADFPRLLPDCLELHESLARRLAKLQGYASLQSQVQWSDARFQDMQAQAGRLLASLAEQKALIDSRLLAADEAEMKARFGNEPRLAPYRNALRQVLENRGHALDAEAARIVSRAGLFADGSRVAADCLRNLDMPPPEAVLPDGTRLSLTGREWWRLSRSPVAAERRAADEAPCLNRRRYENTFAALLDTGVKRDLFQATVRRFPDCLSAELQPYGVPAAVYRNMVQSLRGRLAPYHRFLRLRRRILGLAELHPYDNGLPTVPGDDPRFTFAEARKLVEESLRPLGAEYAGLARRAFDERWFDVYQHKDRMCFGSAQSLPGVHPFISLDFRGGFFDLLTMAHELGHALNFYLAEKAQPFAASDVVWFVSEVPSTFNEVVLMEHLLERASDDRGRLAALARLLERLDVLLFFSARQAEMQLAMHEHVEAGGTLTPAWLNAKQLELSRFYQGHDRGVMVVDDYVQSEWNHPNSFFAPFQGYYYVVGAVASLALAGKVRSNSDAAAKYVAFLKSGGSRPILEVLKEMGIDLATSKPYEDAMAAYERLVVRMEELQARLSASAPNSGQQK
jgi:oligoendopeptidase F